MTPLNLEARGTKWPSALLGGWVSHVYLNEHEQAVRDYLWRVIVRLDGCVSWIYRSVE
jgi:hypothetical protein